MATTTIYPYGQSGSSVSGSGGFILVTTLPTAGAATTGAIYLVPTGTGDTKDMYVTALQDGVYRWTRIGSTDINLSGYATQVWVEARDVDLTVEQYEALVSDGQVDPTKRYFVDEEE